MSHPDPQQSGFNRKARHSARLSAVQALYQMDLGGSGSRQVVRDFTDHWQSKDRDNAEKPRSMDTEFFTQLVNGVVEDQRRIDQTIAGRLSEKWHLSRMDATLRAIVRSAVYEVLHHEDIPAIVIIDEYVSVTDQFFEERETGFVNATIESLAKEYRPHEFGVPGER